MSRGRLEIREATPDDAEGIVAVLNPIIEAGTYTVLDTPLTADAEREFIRSCSPRGVFLVAIDPADGAVVGFQNTQPLVTYTHAFDHVGETGTYVDLSRRRQGMATQLFQASFAIALKKATRRSSPWSGPTIRRRCRPTCTMASTSSAPPAGTPRCAAGTWTRR